MIRVECINWRGSKITDCDERINPPNIVCLLDCPYWEPNGRSPMTTVTSVHPLQVEVWVKEYIGVKVQESWVTKCETEFRESQVQRSGDSVRN